MSRLPSRALVIMTLASAVLSLASCAADRPRFEIGTAGTGGGQDSAAGASGVHCANSQLEFLGIGCSPDESTVTLLGVVTARDAVEVELLAHTLLAGPGCGPKAAALGQTCKVLEGDVLRVAWDGRLPVWGSCANVAVGDEVLAFYKPSRTPSAREIELTRWRDPALAGRVQLGAGTTLFEEDVIRFAEGGAGCVEAYVAANGCPPQVMLPDLSHRAQPEPLPPQPPDCNPAPAVGESAP